MAVSTDQRLLLNVELQPAIGQRFQPTGFPDLGAADYEVPVGADATTSNLLIESAQSMANRLEGVAWDSLNNQPDPVVDGLPYVRVLNKDGEYLTSSRTEAHRLASAFIKDSSLDGTSMVTELGDRMGLIKDHPTDHRRVAAALFSIDPFVLIHGVFFADKKWEGQPKIARAITSFIEAHNVRRADSGGVKRDHVRTSIESGMGNSSEGYGSVPFSRTEWTAEQIVAYFSLDIAQLRSYGLSDDATELLRTLALWEVRTLLDGGLRLRTACDLTPVSNDYRDQVDESLPGADELAAAIRSGIDATAAERDGAGVLDVVWDGGKKKSGN